MDNASKILMVYIEPTPYILDLLLTLQSTWHSKIDVLFLQDNFTQQWKLSLPNAYIILPSNKKQKIKSLYLFLIQKKYHCIFLAGWSHPITLTFLMMSKLRRIPVIVDSDTPLLPHTSRLKRILKSFLYPPLFLLPNLFLAGGTRQARYLMHYRVPKRKIILEKMTVDVLAIQKKISQFSNEFRIEMREKLGLSPQDIVFLFVGRLIERKGILEILSTFSEMHRPHAKCILIGDGELRNNVEVAAKHYPNIIYAGWLNQEKIIEYYFICDVVILPAHWEPWGLVINEAMASGKPVIVSNAVGCVDDLVIHNKTGLITQPSCLESLKNSIEYFLNNPEKIQTMSYHAFELISKWTMQDSARQISRGVELCILG